MQLARMGDLLQILPLLRELRNADETTPLSLLVDHRNVDLAKRLKMVDQLFSVDLANLVREMAEPGKPLFDRYAALADWVASMREWTFSEVYNLNYLPAASLIAALLAPGRVKGFGLGPGGRAISNDPATSCLLHAVRHRRLNRMHLVDLFRNLAPSNDRPVGPLRDAFAQGIDVGDEERDRMDRRLRLFGIRGDDRVVGFQLGAGHPARQWPLSFFAALGERIVGRLGGKIILLGGPGETPLGGTVREAMDPYVHANTLDLIGRTNIGELIFVLRRCDVLVGNNTGTLHLADAVGTRVVGLFMGPAYAWETGPYGEDQLILQGNLPCSPCTDRWAETQCADWSCRWEITPEGVFQALLRAIGHDSPAWNRPRPDAVRLYRSRAEDGWVRYSPVDPEEADPSHVAALLYRELWRERVRTRQSGYIPERDLPEKAAVFRNILSDFIPPSRETAMRLLELSGRFRRMASSLHARIRTDCREEGGGSGTADGPIEAWFTRMRGEDPLLSPLIDSYCPEGPCDGGPTRTVEEADTVRLAHLAAEAAWMGSALAELTAAWVPSEGMPFPLDGVRS